MNIVCVCLGNICRSPAAEEVLRTMLGRDGHDDVTVSSAGTADYHIGDPAAPQTIAEGRRRGYEITNRGSQFTAAGFDGVDLILAMDTQNLLDLRRLADTEAERNKVVRLGLFDPQADLTDHDSTVDVVDPWGKPDAAFAVMYDHIERCCAGLVDRLNAGTVGEIGERSFRG